MTKTPISTISYNTEGFLREKLDEWIDQHLIQAYQYIKHIGEDGDKDHIHLRIEPNKRLDPMELTEALREYEPGNDKPLGVRPWRNSKEEDWILYAVHDPIYLLWKYGEEYKNGKEKLPYFWENIKVSQFYDMEVAYIRAQQFLKHSAAQIIKDLQEGKNALNLISEGADPNRVRSCLAALTLTSYERLSFQYSELQKHCTLLEIAIKNFGLEIIIQEDGTYILENTT